MNVQATYPSQSNPMGNPPVLGQQASGMSGGMQTQGANMGLNPKARELQSYGRGDDTMLVHMTPNEVNSLQGLAMAHGGSLTINPDTGLPEAGWLGNLLPTILGGVLAATGVGAPLAAGIIGAGQTAITGDLKKGLMAGLGAFGGASLAGAAGIGSSISKNALGVLGDKAGILGAKMGAGMGANVVSNAAGAVGSNAASPFLNAAVPKAIAAPVAAGAAAPATAVSPFLNAAAPKAIAAPTANIASKAGALAGNVAANVPAKGGLSGFFQSFGDTAKAGLPKGLLTKAAPAFATMGLINSLSGPNNSGAVDSRTGAIDNSYQGPYYNEPRSVVATPMAQELTDPAFSGERTWFDRSAPSIYNMQGQMVQPGSNTAPGTELFQPVLNPKAKKGQPMYSFVSRPYMGPQSNPQMMGYAEGGKVDMDDGAFVMPARETAEFGNGSTEAGQRYLAGLGGVPIRGKGDGVSDSIPASIGGSTHARVANGEVLFQRPAVERMGRGDHKAGTKKLYDLMAKAERSRKRAPRGGLNSLKASAK